MASTFKVLGQSAPLAATLTDLYTVPASTSSVISSIVVCNQSATATTYRIAVRPAGAAISSQHYQCYDATILGNETRTFTLGITLATTDVVSVYNTLATCSFSIYGQEIT